MSTAGAGGHAAVHSSSSSGGNQNSNSTVNNGPGNNTSSGSSAVEQRKHQNQQHTTATNASTASTNHNNNAGNNNNNKQTANNNSNNVQQLSNGIGHHHHQHQHHGGSSSQHPQHHQHHQQHHHMGGYGGGHGGGIQHHGGPHDSIEHLGHGLPHSRLMSSGSGHSAHGGHGPPPKIDMSSAQQQQAAAAAAAAAAQQQQQQQQQQQHPQHMIEAWSRMAAAPQIPPAAHGAHGRHSATAAAVSGGVFAPSPAHSHPSQHPAPLSPLSPLDQQGQQFMNPAAAAAAAAAAAYYHPSVSPYGTPYGSGDALAGGAAAWTGGAAGGDVAPFYGYTHPPSAEYHHGGHHAAAAHLAPHHPAHPSSQLGSLPALTSIGSMGSLVAHQAASLTGVASDPQAVGVAATGLFGPVSNGAYPQHAHAYGPPGGFGYPFAAAGAHSPAPGMQEYGWGAAGGHEMMPPDNRSTPHHGTPTAAQQQQQQQQQHAKAAYGDYYMYDLMTPAAIAVNGVSASGDKTITMGGLKGLECQLSGLSIAAPASSTIASATTTTTSAPTIAGSPHASKEASAIAVSSASNLAATSGGSTGVTQASPASASAVGTGQLAASLEDHDDATDSGTVNPHASTAAGQSGAHETAVEQSNDTMGKSKRDEFQEKGSRGGENNTASGHGNVANGSTSDANDCGSRGETESVGGNDSIGHPSKVSQSTHESTLMGDDACGVSSGENDGLRSDLGVDDGQGEGNTDDGGRVSWASMDSQPPLKGHQVTSNQASTIADDNREVSVTVTRSSVSDKEGSAEPDDDVGNALSQTATGSLSISTWDWSAETTTKDWSASPPPQDLEVLDPVDRNSPVPCDRPVVAERRTGPRPIYDDIDIQDTREDSNEEPAEASAESQHLLQELIRKNNYNPSYFDFRPEGARYFVIKSYSEDDVHRSIKYSIWCSTERGNKKLDIAYKEQQSRNGNRPIYLFYSVNASGHFCGMAQMTSPVDYNASTGVWAQDKWKGKFSVKWIFVKDIPNNELRHIVLENNDGKPVTNSRDTQEVPEDKGRLMLKILTNYRHQTSLFDDFMHYEDRQQQIENERRQMNHSHHGPQLRDRSGPSGPGGGVRGGFRDRERGPSDMHHDDYRDHNGHHNHRDHPNANNRDFGGSRDGGSGTYHHRDYRDNRDGRSGGSGGHRGAFGFNNSRDSNSRENRSDGRDMRDQRGGFGGSNSRDGRDSRDNNRDSFSNFRRRDNRDIRVDRDRIDRGIDRDRRDRPMEREHHYHHHQQQQQSHGRDQQRDHSRSGFSFGSGGRDGGNGGGNSGRQF